MFLKKAGIFFVALCLCFAGIACGRPFKTDPTGTITIHQSDNKTDEETDFSSVDSEPGPFGKYSPSIEINFVRTIDEDTSNNILPNTPGETMEDNRWLDAYAEELGIQVSYDWMESGGYESDAYRQKLNVTIASGNLPDVLFVKHAQLRELYDSDMIADLTPYWEEYASDLMREYYTARGPGVLESSTFDNQLMGLLANPDIITEGSFLWLRMDWLNKLDLEPPETMQDVLDIAQAFTTQDPNETGVNDTYGLGVISNLYGGAMGLEAFFSGYHAYPFMWVEQDDGTLVYGSTLPEVKTALEQLAVMYALGQIDPEFAVKNISNVAQYVADGRIGMGYGKQWNPMYPLISSYYVDRQADWQGFPIVSADDQPAKSPEKFGDILYIVVNKHFPYPEALIKMCNLHVELCWGETGDFNKYFMPKENNSVGVWKFSPVNPFPPKKNLDAFIAIDEARKNNTLSQLQGEAATIQRNIDAFLNGDHSQWGWYKIYGPEGVLRWSHLYEKEDRFLADRFTGAPTATMVSVLPALQQMENEVFTRIIMGETSDIFDQFVADWYNLSGDIITQEVNQWKLSQP